MAKQKRLRKKKPVKRAVVTGSKKKESPLRKAGIKIFETLVINAGLKLLTEWIFK